MRYKRIKSETKRIANSVLFTAIVLFFFTLASFLSYHVGVQKRNAIEGGVIVEAEIVDVRRNSSAVRSSSHLVYEYWDENGIYYTGWGASNFVDEYEARKYIGTKIDIYIDGKGNSIAVGHVPGDKASIIVAIIFIILTIIAFTFYVKLLLRDKKEKIVREQDRKKAHPGLEGASFLNDLQKFNAKKEDAIDFQQDAPTTLEHKEI